MRSASSGANLEPMTIVATQPPSETLVGSSPACAIPDGTAHALDLGAGCTWCGIDVAWLTAWPEVAWPPSGMAATDTCPVCARGEVEA